MSQEGPGGGGELRAAFAELRQVEEAGAPELDRLLARGRGGEGMVRRAHPTAPHTAAPSRVRSAHHLLAAGAVAVLLAAALGLWLGDGDGGGRRAPRGAEAVSLVDWVAPTDFLLETPGIELLRSTPEIPGTLPSTFSGLTTGEAR